MTTTSLDEREETFRRHLEEIAPGCEPWVPPVSSARRCTTGARPTPDFSRCARRSCCRNITSPKTSCGPFEHATFKTALLLVTPIVGAFAALRLVLPIAPDWIMHGIVLISLFTAAHAAGTALIQREARRFFCDPLSSRSSLEPVKLERSGSGFQQRVETRTRRTALT